MQRWPRLLALSLAVAPSAWSASAQADCVTSRADLLAAQGNSVEVCGNITLRSTDRIRKSLHFVGREASHSVVECNGATLDEGDASRDMIEVRSRLSAGSWSRPVGVTLRDCTIKGSVRIYGMGKNGEAPHVVNSSYSADHVQKVRAAAPLRTTFERVVIEGSGRIPLYFSPGVSRSRFIAGEITGDTNSVAVYFGAESHANVIRDSYIHAQPRSRELIAIDASDHNKLINNRFASLNHGGIYLYRNCGEAPKEPANARGGVRHTTPSHNHIINNSFFYNKYNGEKPAVFLGSRNGNRNYCHKDSEGSHGSAISDLDYAQHNVVAMNQIFKFAPDKMIRTGRNDTDAPNFIFENETVTQRIARTAGCFEDDAFGSPWREHGEELDVVKGDASSPWCLTMRCEDGEYRWSGMCEVTNSNWTCRASGSNAGCEGDISCPSGTRIVGAVAACNLEWGTVSTAQLESLPVGEVKVLRASDRESDGLCRIGGSTLRSGTADVLALRPALRNEGRAPATHSRTTRVQCREKDNNGGDCHLRARLYCQ